MVAAIVITAALSCALSCVVARVMAKRCVDVVAKFADGVLKMNEKTMGDVISMISKRQGEMAPATKAYKSGCASKESDVATGSRRLV